MRIRPWRDRPFDIQAGRIPPTFGAFARREYGAGNPLIGYPLAYQYLTAVRPDALPASTDDVLRMRARGWRPNYPIGSLDIAPGLPLITAFRWDTGVQARVGPDSMNVSVAVTNGTASDPRTRDNNGGKQIAGRVQWKPSAALTLGGSAASGAYVADAALASATMLGGTSRSNQHALGIDVDYSRDHWMVRGEVIWNRWQVPTLTRTLDAASGFVEGRYKISPGVFVAGRIDRLGFSELPSSARSRTWDAPVTRLETGVGYYIRRNLLAKAAYQHNWRDGGQVTQPRAVRGATAFLVVKHARHLCPLLFALCSVHAALSLRAASAQTAAGIIRGRVDVKRAPAQIERRPNVNDLGMHARHDAPDLRRSVVYLESAPALAFPDTEPQRATLDQRNETFVPHVLAITVGTTVDFPNSDNIVSQRVLAARRRASISAAMRQDDRARFASIARESSACSAKSTRT